MRGFDGWLCAVAGLALGFGACKGERSSTEPPATRTDVPPVRSAETAFDAAAAAATEVVERAGFADAVADAEPGDVASTTEAEQGAEAPGEVPPENREAGAPPGPESGEALARKILAAVLADDPGLALDTMFPAAAFEILKDLPQPSAYHRRMVRWYEEDVHAEHERLDGAATLEFVRFRLGRCTWQAPHTEGNLLPYWSCRHNWVWATASGREWKIEIRVVINWGPTWYVAHFGPVRR